MAAIVSAQTGDWNVTATWAGGVVPGNGDTVTLGDGHTITIPTGYTAIVGASPADDASTPAIQCASTAGTGILTINGTLVFRGSIRQANATWTASASAIIEHDSSLSADPANTHYTWQIGMIANQANAKLVLTGTSGAGRVKVRNFALSGRFGGFHQGSSLAQRNLVHTPTDGLAGAGRIEATYTNFTGMGFSTYNSITANIGASQSFILDHVIFDDCNQIGFVKISTALGAAVTSTLQIDRLSFLNPSNVVGIFGYMNTAPTTGVRTISNSFLEGSWRGPYLQFWTANNVIFAGTTTSDPLDNGGGIQNFALAEDVAIIIRNTNSGGPNIPSGGVYRRLMSLSVQRVSSQDHLRLSARTGAMTFDGVIFERESGEIAGDGLLIVQGNTQAASVDVKNVLIVPTGDAANYGVAKAVIVVNNFSTGLTSISVSNVTRPAHPESQLISIEGTYTTKIGQVAAVDNNLTWAKSAGSTGSIVENASGELVTIVDDTVTEADYNMSYNVTGPLYDLPAGKISGTPGANDISPIDPQFFDPTRKLIVWAQGIDAGISDWTVLFAELRKMNDDTGYNTALDLRDYYNWVRAGWAPTNAALATAGKGGTYIGAVDVYTPPAGGSGSNRRAFGFGSSGFFGF